METLCSFRRLGYALGALVLVLTGGAVGFHAAVHESWLQSFYRAVVTVSLTGLDRAPRNDSALIITIVLALAGIIIFAYIGSLVVEAIARGVIGDVWAERRRRKAIEALHDHYIICGFGRVGRRVAEEFRHEGAPFVVLDFSPEPKEAAAESGVLDAVTTASGHDLRFEEIEVTPESGRGGKSIRGLDIRRETGALVVALRKRDGVIAAGTEGELRPLEQIFAPRETVAR